MNTHKSDCHGDVSLFLSSACVSTTTGSVTEHERDDEDAAELNYQLGADITGPATTSWLAIGCNWRLR